MWVLHKVCVKCKFYNVYRNGGGGGVVEILSGLHLWGVSILLSFLTFLICNCLYKVKTAERQVIKFPPFKDKRKAFRNGKVARYYVLDYCSNVGFILDICHMFAPPVPKVFKESL